MIKNSPCYCKNRPDGELCTHCEDAKHRANAPTWPAYSEIKEGGYGTDYQLTRHLDSVWKRDVGDHFWCDEVRTMCECGNTAFTLEYGEYRLFATCTKCGTKELVYAG